MMDHRSFIDLFRVMKLVLAAVCADVCMTSCQASHTPALNTMALARASQCPDEWPDVLNPNWLSLRSLRPFEGHSPVVRDHQ